MAEFCPQNTKFQPINCRVYITFTVKKIHYYIIHFDWEEKFVLNIVYRGLCFPSSSVRQDPVLIHSTSRGIAKTTLFLVQMGVWKEHRLPKIFQLFAFSLWDTSTMLLKQHNKHRGTALIWVSYESLYVDVDCGQGIGKFTPRLCSKVCAGISVSPSRQAFHFFKHPSSSKLFGCPLYV